MRLVVPLFAACILIAALLAPVTAQATGTCGLTSPAFCETFDAPAGIGNRSGQLNGTLWGESHSGGISNSGQGDAAGWAESNQSVCGTTQSVTPDHDAYICNGQLVEGQDDAGGVQAVTIYPKQPFDFAGRTGKVTFDVSNNTQGSHAAWPEFWITDQPVPGPFAHENTYFSLPRNGLGIRFAGCTNNGGDQGATCPDGAGYVGVDSAISVTNYVENDTGNSGNLQLQGLGADVKESTGTGSSMNHYEIDVSQNQVDIYGTDAGTVAPLKHLAVIKNANLNFTRGLVWIVDAHYNGNKFNTQGIHTFTWDNVGFDGPVLPRDLSYDVLDKLTPDGLTSQNSGLPILDLGWNVGAGNQQSYTLTGMANPSTAVGADLLFSFSHGDVPTGFNYTINGHAHSEAWPYPDTTGYTVRTLAIPLVLSDLVAGTNTFSLGPIGQPVTLSNLDIVLQGAGGGGSGTPVPTPTTGPTNTPAPTNVPTSTPVPTMVPTGTPAATPVATMTPAPTVGPTSVPTAVPTPAYTCALSIDSSGNVTGTCVQN